MPRITAWSCLRSGHTAPLQIVDKHAAQQELDGRDRALARRLVGTEVRRRGTLRAILGHFQHRKNKPDVAAHLHLGIVQLLFLDRIPDHAGLSSTLEAVHQTLGPSKVRAVNGILRNIQRARHDGLSGDPRRDLVGTDLSLEPQVFRDPVQHPLLWVEDALSLPATLAKRWAKRHGEERMHELARYALDEPALSVRCVGIERDALAAELTEAGVPPGEGTHPHILLCRPDEAGEVLATEPFQSGRATIQGESALRAAELVGAQEGEQILDLCAAPGGKTAVLAASGAQVVACDVELRKIERLRDTLQRLHLSERVELICSEDARELDPERQFDAVLVDAPCSNTGVLAARPGARWRFGPQSMAGLSELQINLLAVGASRTRPGGRLIWSTCSLEPEENEQRVRKFLADNAGWELEEEHARLPGAPPAPIDGGYAARLRRSG